MLIKDLGKPQSRKEIVKNLTTIANSDKCFDRQTDHVQAALWNAIETLEDLEANYKQTLKDLANNTIR